MRSLLGLCVEIPVSLLAIASYAYVKSTATLRAAFGPGKALWLLFWEEFAINRYLCTAYLRTVL